MSLVDRNFYFIVNSNALDYISTGSVSFSPSKLYKDLFINKNILFIEDEYVIKDDVNVIAKRYGLNRLN